SPGRRAAAPIWLVPAVPRGILKFMFQFKRGGGPTMSGRNRREFLADVGRGMVIASVGPAVAADLGLATARAADAPDRLTFGPLEPLVGLMQDTPAARLQPLL